MEVYIPMESRLQIRVNIGFDDNGDPVTRSLNFADVQSEAVALNVAAVSAALGGLLDYPITETRKIDTNVVE
ncbi:MULTISPECIES: DUF1659 domain-containing protein [Aminobacterium]|jgi:hypothetical protein|uniref:DUF1659 domain-containing protein n=1 Tax=Aminobacterium colombiense (strain DSM 12261 / ALA-1) TaxID=572547 RepID=D5EH24_AMICL|nr:MULTISPECIES: DUF1659 domain-containing protein [Aminobacterium]MDD2379742.1 DUF1659 domain-containing protein [Aminobacterium colombiense]ADE57856.1 hypothetical protein Amico_1742 [Aminobacterium colombiense DSM 12261]MDD3768849.1 DUF1659 domain-containing protein [Aminobacterium colombiense]MDD4266191.1 DUF1659 domain-containing protein [Aminobacterium colombiense]MDD4586095.1 DUF1659 domain-containing protein [Aminobacterium colombiense]